MFAKQADIVSSRCAFTVKKNIDHIVDIDRNGKIKKGMTLQKDSRTLDL